MKIESSLKQDVTLVVTQFGSEPDEDDDVYVEIPGPDEIDYLVLEEELRSRDLALIPADEEPVQFDGTTMRIWCYRINT